PAQSPTAGQTGAMRIVAFDANGAPAPGGCYRLEGPLSLDACDNAANDADPNDGSIRIDDLPPGTYQVSESRVPPSVQPAASGANVELQAGQRLRVDFAPGAAPTGGADTGGQQQPSPQNGELAIVVTATDGSQPAGTCASLSGPATIGPLCDNADLDRDPTADRLLVTNVPPGDYTVLFAPPAGYQPAPQQSVTVEAGQRAQIDLTLQPKPQAPGAVEATIAGPDGAAVGGCIALDGPQQFGPVCDNQNGDAASEPGRIRIDNVPVGTYSVTASSLPQQFAAPSPQQAQVASGQTADVAFALQRGTGTLTLFVEDPDGNRIGGGCFTLTGPETLQDICDRGDDGTLNFPDVPAGDYTIHQERARQDFTPAADQSASVPAGGTAEATFVNQPVPATQTPTPEPTATATATPQPTATPPPTAVPTETPIPTETPAPTATTAPTAAPTATPEPGTIEIHAVDAQGQAVDAAGACYAISGETDLAPVCDNGRDDANDQPGVVS
ncbi:MAG TPA: carboxypeptidase-like regulatory domain-containing protein, partial [Thermomicrobiales bacterium]|nr:carboxypeptidase-like regulatory domain-containing protein [Thermomicrobiales bacterium]